MANIIELQKMAESMPDRELIKAAQGQGRIPAYVAITEMNARVDFRKAYEAQLAQAEMPQGTVAEQVISEFTQPGLQGMAEQTMRPRGFQAGGLVGFQEGKSTSNLFTGGDYIQYVMDNTAFTMPDESATSSDDYLLSAGIDPRIVANLNDLQRANLFRAIKERIRNERVSDAIESGLKRQGVIKNNETGFPFPNLQLADPISASAVNIDSSPDVVPGSQIVDKDEPMVEQPSVNTLDDYSKITDLIMKPVEFEPTKLDIPQSVKDLRSRIAAKKDKPVQGLQAIDIPIKSAEEKQNELEVSALGDLAVAISSAKNLGDLGVGLGTASKGVQALKDKQEARTLDARFKQRQLQKQDIEFARAQEREVDEALAKVASIDVSLAEAQRNADFKERERLIAQKENLIKSLSDVEKLRIYREQILQSVDKNKNTQRQQLLDTVKLLQERLDEAVGISDEERAAIENRIESFMAVITSELVNTNLPTISTGGSNVITVSDFVNE